MITTASLLGIAGVRLSAYFVRSRACSNFLQSTCDTTKCTPYGVQITVQTLSILKQIQKKWPKDMH